MTVRTKFIDARTAALLRETDQWGPPARLEPIAARLGVAIETSSALGSGVRAEYSPHRAIIEVSPMPPRPTRFSIAHELGHAALDHGGSCSFDGEPSLTDVDLDLDAAETGLDHEAEANYFAGRLLVPRSWLKDAVEESTVSELENTFDVSKSVLLIAAQTYRLFNKLRV